MSERIANHVKALGLEHDAVVVGDGPLDAEIRSTNTIEITVDPGDYRALREHHAWQEVLDDNSGRVSLHKDNVVVGTEWAGQALDRLNAHGYSLDGVRFASLGDVYAWKQHHARPQDHDDLALIRERLYDRPMPRVMLDREAAFVREHVPEEVRDEPALILAANGLYIVRTIFGDYKNHVHAYSGSVETYGVPGIYHEFWHSGDGLERVGRHMARANRRRRRMGRTILFPLNDQLATLIGFAYHDSRMGDGRQSANPTGFDELKAAEMAARHLDIAGVTQDDIPEKSYVGIRTTGYNETTQSQDINPERGYMHIQESMSGTDLGSFAETVGVLDAIRVTIEDLCRVGAGLGRPLAIAAAKQSKPVTTPEEGLAIIDGDPALRKLFGERLVKSGAFCESYQYADSWALTNKAQQKQNAQHMISLGHGVIEGEITAMEAYLLSKQFVASSALREGAEKTNMPSA